MSDYPIQISSMSMQASNAPSSSSLYIPPGTLNSIPIHFQDATAYGAAAAALGGPTQQQQQIDLNSPEMFKNNMHVAQEHILRIQQLAQNAIEAIGRAYHPHSSPVQASGEVIALKQALEAFGEFLRESGVGSLPLVAASSSSDMAAAAATAAAGATGAETPTTTTTTTTERKMIEDMAKSVQALFEKRQRRQENAAGVASLLMVAPAAAAAPSETRGRRQS